MGERDVAHPLTNGRCGGLALAARCRCFLEWNVSTKVPGRFSACSQWAVWQRQDTEREDKGKTNPDLDNKPLFVLEAQNGSILNGGASESDASINFNLLSPSLIFTIVHRLSVVTALSLKKKKKESTKDASGGTDGTWGASPPQGKLVRTTEAWQCSQTLGWCCLSTYWLPIRLCAPARIDFASLYCKSAVFFHKSIKQEFVLEYERVNRCPGFGRFTGNNAAFCTKEGTTWFHCVIHSNFHLQRIKSGACSLQQPRHLF